MAQVTEFAQPGATFINAFERSREVAGERRKERQQENAFRELSSGIQDPAMRNALVAMGPERGSAFALERQQAQERAAAESQSEFMGSIPERVEPFAEMGADALANGDEQGFRQALEAFVGEISAQAEAEGVDIPEGQEQRLLERFSQFSQIKLAERERSADPNEGFERVTRDDGRVVFVRADGEVRETPVTARDNRSSTTIDMGGVLGEAGRQGQMRTEVESARNSMGAAADVLDTIGDLRVELEGTGKGSVGLVSTARRITQGAMSQLDALASSSPTGARLVSVSQRAMQDENLTDEAKEHLFADPSLSAVDFLLNSLVYSVARANEPGGRLSNNDVQSVRQAMGIGPMGSDQQLAEVLRVMEGRANRQYERNADRYYTLMGQERPQQARGRTAAPPLTEGRSSGNGDDDGPDFQLLPDADVEAMSADRRAEYIRQLESFLEGE